MPRWKKNTSARRQKEHDRGKQNIHQESAHRLTTTYGRATDYPTHFEVLEQMSDQKAAKKSLHELTMNMEHQSTLWHATPFSMVFLSRILDKAISASDQNPVAYSIANELLDLFALILQCFHDGDTIEHAAPLPCFSDLLDERYLWSEEYSEEDDELRYEEEDVFSAEEFYSFYYYSWMAVLAYRDKLSQENSPEFAPKITTVLELL